MGHGCPGRRRPVKGDAHWAMVTPDLRSPPPQPSDRARRTSPHHGRLEAATAPSRATLDEPPLSDVAAVASVSGGPQRLRSCTTLGCFWPRMWPGPHGIAWSVNSLDVLCEVLPRCRLSRAVVEFRGVPCTLVRLGCPRCTLVCLFWRSLFAMRRTSPLIASTR